MGDVVRFDQRSRRGLKADLIALDDVPSLGELCFETDTGDVKYGDGLSTYSALPYHLGGGSGSGTGSVSVAPSSITAGGAADGDVMVWDAGTGHWVPQAPSGGGGGGGGGVGSQVGYAYVASSTPASTGASIPYDNTVPQSGEGDAYSAIDTTIVPTDATSILEIEVDIPMVAANGVHDVTFALFRDGGAGAIASAIVSTTNNGYSMNFKFRAFDIAGSTSSTTFKLRWGTDSGTAYLLRTASAAAFHGGVLIASMTVREIQQ